METTTMDYFETMSTARIAALYNSIPGVHPVSKFTNRSKAIRRTTDALDNAGKLVEIVDGSPVLVDAPTADCAAETNGEQTSGIAQAAAAAETVEAVEAAPVAAIPAQAPAPVVTAEGTLPRAGSKNAAMLAMASRPGGATEEEICRALGWKACAVTLRRVCRKAGYDLQVDKTQGERRGRYVATPARWTAEGPNAVATSAR